MEIESLAVEQSSCSVSVRLIFPEKIDFMLAAGWDIVGEIGLFSIFDDGVSEIKVAGNLSSWYAACMTRINLGKILTMPDGAGQFRDLNKVIQ